MDLLALISTILIGSTYITFVGMVDAVILLGQLPTDAILRTNFSEIAWIECVLDVAASNLLQRHQLMQCIHPSLVRW